MLKRIGYLIPEFPGQTHIFFWREIKALEAMGLEIDLVSTKLPPVSLMSHTWTQEAQQKTFYLFPPKNWLLILQEFLRSGFSGWLRCLSSVITAKELSIFGRLRLMGLIVMGAELAALSRKRQWQQVHVHSCADAAYIALYAYLLANLPYSLTLHGFLQDYGLDHAQKWSHAQFAIVITQQIYDQVQQTLWGSLPEHIAIAPMGVDLTTFRRQTPYQSWNGIGKIYIFSCGRLNTCKGHRDLIQAVKILEDQGLKIHLEIAGEDEQGGAGYRKTLEQLIQDLNLADSVQLLGAISEVKVQQSLEKAHIFVLASLNEPLGVAIMEAMAMQVPVIVTSAGGVKELVEDGKNGLLVNPNAPEELAETIQKLLNDSELAYSLGNAAAETILNHFSSQKSADILIKSIEKTLNN